MLETRNLTKSFGAIQVTERMLFADSGTNVAKNALLPFLQQLAVARLAFRRPRVGLSWAILRCAGAAGGGRGRRSWEVICMTDIQT